MYAEYCKAMESPSRSTPEPQQPCPYRLTSGLKQQYTLLNVPPASPTRRAARDVKSLSFILLPHKYCIKIKIQCDLCDKCDEMLGWLRHSFSDEQHKAINNNCNQHLLKTWAFCDNYNPNITEAEKESKGSRDQILGCLESRVQLSP